MSTKERLDQARSEILNTSIHSFRELMSINRPPTRLLVIFSLVMILLESKKNIKTEEEGMYDWKDCLKQINGSGDIRKILVDIESISKETLEKAEKFISNHEGIMDHKSYGTISLIGEKLCIWADAIIAHSKQL